MKVVLFYLIICVFVVNISIVQSSCWHWTWSCNKRTGQCEKSSHPVAINQSITGAQFFSQNVCRLTCGKYGALWPVPTISTYLDTALVYFHPSAIDYSLQQSTSKSQVFFNEISEIFNNNINLECGNECNIKSESTISIYASSTTHDTDLHPYTDESYSLEVTTKSQNTLIQIHAETLFGVRHALETLSQLIASYKVPHQDSNVKKVGLVLVANAKIKDKPVYPHRGLLLDTARNYLPLDAIKKQIDAMGASKMNVFHWHATDSQSFPIVSSRIPQFAKYGAYSSNHVYHLDDIYSLNKYATYRGVRIIFEIDAPSHAGNGWQWGPMEDLGNLAVCVNKIPWRQYCIQPPCGQLNPVNKNVYKILGELYKDLLEVGTKGEWFHMGGDEVFINCWNATDEITSYMTKKGWGRSTEDFLKLWSEFQDNSLQTYDSIVGNNNTPIILWSSQLTEPEYIEKYLSKNRYVIQTWVPTTNDMPQMLLEKGYRLIISTKNAWYLDHGFWGTTQYYNWRTVYKNRIPRHQGVIGGEACMWGEYVDKNSLDSKIWPRVAAVAERLWSDPGFETSVVETRFYRQRERLVTRGIAADALAPGWCFQNEGECR